MCARCLARGASAKDMLVHNCGATKPSVCPSAQLCNDPDVRLIRETVVVSGIGKH